MHSLILRTENESQRVGYFFSFKNMMQWDAEKVQVKLSFIVIPLHVRTYSGTKCRTSQDHGAT